MLRRWLAGFIIVVLTPTFCLLALEVFLQLGNKFEFFIYEKSTFYPPSHFTLHQDEKLYAFVKERMQKSIDNFVDYPYRARENELHAEAKDPNKKLPQEFSIRSFSEFKNTQFISEMTTLHTKLTLYSVPMSFDQYATRTVPDRPQKADHQYVLAGCSFTFSEGVKDEESMPAYFQKLRPKSQVFNMGIGGFSLTNVVYELDSQFDQRYQHLPIKNGTFIYTFMDNHLNRIICPLSCLRPENDWMLSNPWYDLQPNQWLIHKGNFYKRTKLNEVYRFINLFKTVEFLGIDWPLMNSDGVVRFFIAITQKMKQLVESKMGIKDFYVALMPVSSSIASPKLEKQLQEAGIKVLDLRFPKSAELLNYKSAIPGDGHNTALSNELFALTMEYRLREFESKQRVNEMNTHALRSRQQEAYQQ